MRLICERCTDSTHLPEFTGIVVVQLIPDSKRCDVKVKSWYFHTTIPYEWSEFQSKTHWIWNGGRSIADVFFSGTHSMHEVV